MAYEPGKQASGPEEAPPDVNSNYRKPILQKYTVYETKTRMYIVGSNFRESMFRVLEIDLTVPIDKLSIIEDDVFYTRKEIMQVLAGLEEECESTGGNMVKRITGWGLLGFIRFTSCYYLLMTTKRSQVALIGGHAIYHIDGTELIPIMSSDTYKKPHRSSEESRFLSTLQNLDLSKTFYFSYTYDITHTLQTNVLREKARACDIMSPSSIASDPDMLDSQPLAVPGEDGRAEQGDSVEEEESETEGPPVPEALTQTDPADFGFNEKFVWNLNLLKPVLECYDRVYDWFQPIIHGFIDQANIPVFNRRIYVTLIARRSHHFAGARFLKRGVNDQGNVANEVETEQIVCDMLTSSFHDPGTGFYNNPRYSSYVQHRGSIPLFWSQDSTNITPKPPIFLNVIDPFFSAAALHFDDLFKRYGSPILILNLIKTKEKKGPRETKLLHEFENCVKYLNQFLPKEHKLQYTSWDMSRASKSGKSGQDVIEYLETFADKTLRTTGIFRNGYNFKEMKLQKGICRTNCIDCLDRTNAAQFVIGKRALGYQLYALGIVDEPYLDYDSDAINMLTEMFHNHGDTIALQYGGSHLVNTMETYRKINQWSSQPRDMIESIRRFYSNSFIDPQRQEAINLFLGNYVWEKGQPMLWDLNTDYYLHNDYLGGGGKYKTSYRHWWTDSTLDGYFPSKILPIAKALEAQVTNGLDSLRYLPLEPYAGFFDNYWNETYGPRTFTSFKTCFEFNMNSAMRYLPMSSAIVNSSTGADGDSSGETDGTFGRRKAKRRNSISIVHSASSSKLDYRVLEMVQLGPFQNRKSGAALRPLMDQRLIDKGKARSREQRMKTRESGKRKQQGKDWELRPSTMKPSPSIASFLDQSRSRLWHFLARNNESYHNMLPIIPSESDMVNPLISEAPVPSWSTREYQPIAFVDWKTLEAETEAQADVEARRRISQKEQLEEMLRHSLNPTVSPETTNEYLKWTGVPGIERNSDLSYYDRFDSSLGSKWLSNSYFGVQGDGIGLDISLSGDRNSRFPGRGNGNGINKELHLDSSSSDTTLCSTQSSTINADSSTPSSGKGAVKYAKSPSHVSLSTASSASSTSINDTDVSYMQILESAARKAGKESGDSSVMAYLNSQRIPTGPSSGTTDKKSRHYTLSTILSNATPKRITSRLGQAFSPDTTWEFPFVQYGEDSNNTTGGANAERRDSQFVGQANGARVEGVDVNASLSRERGKMKLSEEQLKARGKKGSNDVGPSINGNDVEHNGRMGLETGREQQNGSENKPENDKDVYWRISRLVHCSEPRVRKEDLQLYSLNPEIFSALALNTGTGDGRVATGLKVSTIGQGFVADNVESSFYNSRMQHQVHHHGVNRFPGMGFA